ncbi:hypothetical protein [Streptomyces sp. SHP 1-2]|uniref:hypothetical protein n=1 Tax=Streptomyces sp. SHP 1-2 TaxID=2769489 RepID=UPI0022389235|nr:hypothetical protein [Streptomyces sp. SHP 1-2]MCW5252244.1 hypothetical protein [Streptomyces sp. SHP 1-2]
MTTVVETYLGWQEPQHLAGCKRPSWAVDLRTDHDEYRRGSSAHDCSAEDCDHGARYARTTVRIVCRSCSAAVVVRGEDAGISEGAGVTRGYGLPPRAVAGLLLWPGEPWLNVGRLSSDEPYDFVVTRTGVTRVTETDVVGVITQHRGKRGAVVWEAAALPTPGRYRRFDWTHQSDGAPLRTVAAAAKWVAARVTARAAGPETGGAR